LWAELEQRRADHEEERLLFLFGGQLQQWTEHEIAKLRGRRKSISLPGGSVGFRSIPSRVQVRDEARVMAWARRNCPAAIVISERLIKTPIIEHVEKSGDIPDGVEITMARDEFYIR
jgi:phage host-nuclease inhibitor protein Gam